ncbi:TPA: hypothetical protein PXO57_004266 [Yersinia enterocolitica]|nr:hypothetical protein [Yersinia enterocolitica]HDL6593535.1 hypothetical protein [Yersinia enterocolitica]HDL7593776.1 hypothetical protein [Yersinia enterocolitica]
MLSKEQLEKIANQGPVDIGGAQNPIVTEMAAELLSLREQLAEQREPFGYISSLCVRDIHKGNSCPLYPEMDEETGYVIPLFTAAKPAGD